MRTGRQCFVLVIVLLIACPILAAEKKREKKAAKKAPPKCPAEQRIEQWTTGLSLTEEQKAKLAPVTKEFGPKLAELMKQRQAIYTPEQKEAMAEARKAAAKEGKKGRELYQAANAAVTPGDEQNAKLAEVRKEISKIEKDLRAAMMEVLTPEQKAEIKKAAKKPAK